MPSTHIAVRKMLQRKDGSESSPFWTNLPRTRVWGREGPPYKAILQNGVSVSLSFSTLAGFGSWPASTGCFPARSASPCLHLGCKRTPPRAGFHRLCGSSMARGRCVSPRQGSCPHRASPGCLSDSSASQQLICG